MTPVGKNGKTVTFPVPSDSVEKTNTNLQVRTTEILAVQLPHRVDRVITILEVNERVVFDFLHPFNLAKLFKTFLFFEHKIKEKIQKKNRISRYEYETVHLATLTFNFSSLVSCVRLRTYNTLTLLIVTSSGSSWGSAQSTIISQPHT